MSDPMAIKKIIDDFGITDRFKKSAEIRYRMSRYRKAQKLKEWDWPLHLLLYMAHFEKDEKCKKVLETKYAYLPGLRPERRRGR